MNDRIPNTRDLANALELRWRLVGVLGIVTDALAVTLGISLLAFLAVILLGIDLPVARPLLLLNGAAIVVGLIVVALRRRDPSRFLIDADRTYGLKSLLAAAWEFGNVDVTTAARTSPRAAFEAAVIRSAEARSEEVDPQTVYPAETPKRAGVVVALVVMLGVLVVLNASGWFDRPDPPYLEEALALEDAGRRLAERAADNEDLQQLADEIRRFGERVRRDGLPEEEARRRIEQLDERMEEQIRNLGRTPPLEFNEEAQIPEDAEETIRRALESGMSQGEVEEFFLQMRSEGTTIPDVVRALEEATPERAPDANLGLDDERVQELMDQLNRPPPEEDAESDIVNELEESRQVLQQMGAGLSELTEGEETEIGEAGESGVGRGGEQGEGSEGEPDQSNPTEDGFGQQGGTRAVEDELGDDFSEPEEESPIFRELQGIVTNDTIMDLIIRELPSEATSVLEEEERIVLFERVIEEAVEREQTPPELDRLVRNYFLRLTRVAQEEAADE